ncbi:MAG: hypothetical protein GX927_13820 [Lentisphaerae bacterium]|nr:hypothetical protein [Lentisphaerota bacterium]
MEKTQLWSAGACSRFQSGGKPPHSIRAAVFYDESKLQCHTSILTKQSHPSKQQPYKKFRVCSCGSWLKNGLWALAHAKSISVFRCKKTVAQLYRRIAGRFAKDALPAEKTRSCAIV